MKISFKTQTNMLKLINIILIISIVFISYSILNEYSDLGDESNIAGKLIYLKNNSKLSNISAGVWLK